ncbi:putative hydantoinase [Naematelia encephala]|uniref:Putative hydantoinase n=1 Tax=Naematelia encephala TaxID=71784 RepID=A0A1Y2ASK5_9TREE|nr:putative hydantoinase [Naematelia encephala]
MTTGPRQILRLGVDCGGTNTDAVLLDLTPGSKKVVLDATKSPTTPEVTHGIQAAVSTVLNRSTTTVQRAGIQAVSIGTTHFVNALITRSSEHLERVAVVRLCGPYSQRTPPFIGFPYELRDIMEGPHFFVNGGLQIDGRQITEVDEAEIEMVCEEIKASGIRCVAIAGVYASIDFTIKQEEHVDSIIKRCIPGIYTSCSKTVANMGMLPRENATILNASLLPYAESTVVGFRTAVTALGLSCPVFVTGNDGTLLKLEQAAKLPIRTFSSGPTNSMRGASFLANLADPYRAKETALVMDIGGTTTEIGVLLPTGFPRQAGNQHELCGVNLNFAMPHVASIGLGGGSIVSRVDGKVSVGPESVGYKLAQDALIFGGAKLTATDISVSAGLADGVGDATLVKGLDAELVKNATARMKAMLELTIDSMKTSSQDVPVYLVGGGAILCPEDLIGVSKVHRFLHYDCANAVGAAIAQVAGSIDTVENMGTRSIDVVQKQVEARAISTAVSDGAKLETVSIIESEVLPIAYTTDRCRFVVKAAGEWDGATVITQAHQDEATHRHPMLTKDGNLHTKPSGRVDTVWQAADILAYKPNVVNGEWWLSELDLDFLAIGSYILGCGGGGDPQICRLALKVVLRSGAKIRVIDLDSLKPEALLGWGGHMGSPEVGSERLLGNEYADACHELLEFLKIEKLDGLVAVEIGGNNGLMNLIIGASNAMDIPVIDGDFMGRAYPTGWQTTPNVFDKSSRGENILPACIASGNGNVMFMTKAQTDRMIDASLRAACVEMGTRVGCAKRPLTAQFCRTAMIRNTVSLSWRIGRAVTLAQKQGNIANIGNVIVDSLGGSATGRVLFAGKVVGVSRRVFKGHSVGEVSIVAASLDEEEEDDDRKRERFSGLVKIPFKNENLLVEHVQDGHIKILASVPDLVAVVDAGNGLALGTQDYKYGQRVIVIGVAAAPQWTSTERGLEIGGLRSFDIHDIPYEPVGEYVKPDSVIDEFNSIV